MAVSKPLLLSLLALAAAGAVLIAVLRDGEESGAAASEPGFASGATTRSADEPQLTEHLFDPLAAPAGTGAGPSFASGGAGGARGDAQDGAKVVGQVILGDAERLPELERVGVVEITRSFDAIAEYRDVKERNNTNARYYFLLQQANDRFRRAVAAEAKAAGLRLVVEMGGVIGVEQERVVDLTAAVVARLTTR